MLPCYAIVLKTVIAAFEPDLPTDEKAETLRSFIWGVIAICIASYFTSYIGYACMQISAERLSFKLRARYLASLMTQEIKFFEEQEVEALPSKISEYFTHIADGGGEKMGQVISTAGATVSGITISLYIHPYYALCLLAYLPFAAIIMTKFKSVTIKVIMKKFAMNAKLGGFTEELLSSMKLIISFGKE